MKRGEERGEDKNAGYDAVVVAKHPRAETSCEG